MMIRMMYFFFTTFSVNLYFLRLDFWYPYNVQTTTEPSCVVLRVPLCCCISSSSSYGSITPTLCTIGSNFYARLSIDPQSSVIKITGTNNSSNSIIQLFNYSITNT